MNGSRGVSAEPAILRSPALARFAALRSEVIDSVTERFYQEHASIYAGFGERGREACREDLSYHLEFLRPVLEFGVITPMVQYLRWLASVLEARNIPSQHLPQSIEWLGEFFATRMMPPDGARVAATLDAVKAEFLNSSDTKSAADTLMPEPWPASDEFEAALLVGDRRRAAAVMDRCLSEGRDLIETEMHVVQSALYRIGQKWQGNQVSVAQEHLATAIAQSLMVKGLIASKLGQPCGKKVLLACVQGNYHSVGLQMVADAFQLAGWDVDYLGADVPTAALVGYVSTWRPHLLGLSVSLPHQLRAVKDVIARLNSLASARPAVMVGGIAINNFDQFAARLGAGATGADAAAAVRVGNQLVSA